MGGEGSYIQANDLKEYLRENTRQLWENDEDPTDGIISDEAYYCPTEEEVNTLLERNPLGGGADLGEGRDCDDYTKILTGKAMEYGGELGVEHSMCFGMAEGEFTWRNGLHFCNWVFQSGSGDEFGSFYWIEPEGGETKELTECTKLIKLFL